MVRSNLNCHALPCFLLSSLMRSRILQILWVRVMYEPFSWFYGGCEVGFWDGIRLRGMFLLGMCRIDDVQVFWSVFWLAQDGLWMCFWIIWMILFAPEASKIGLCLWPLAPNKFFKRGFACFQGDFGCFLSSVDGFLGVHVVASQFQHLREDWTLPLLESPG